MVKEPVQYKFIYQYLAYWLKKQEMNGAFESDQNGPQQSSEPQTNTA